jgi:uncharacterized protein YeaO (DUF488 family)
VLASPPIPGLLREAADLVDLAGHPVVADVSGSRTRTAPTRLGILDRREEQEHTGRVLARYSMIRGASAASLPQGIRQDTRKHTHHVLRPTPEMVAAALGSGDAAAWHAFARAYRTLLEARFAADRTPFDDLAALARTADVYLGCSCPTKLNPDVRRCHTTLALAFLHERYPDLSVRMPVAP